MCECRRKNWTDFILVRLIGNEEINTKHVISTNDGKRKS